MKNWITTRHFDSFEQMEYCDNKRKLIEEMLYMINLPVKAKSDILYIYLILKKIYKKTDYLKI